jgi:hypothetical protein
MNNWCNRKCTWNYNNQCCPETDSHYKDGTVYTKNCSQFLHKDFLKKMDNVLTECGMLPWEMSNKQLKQARHALKQIINKKQPIIECVGYCQGCKNKTPCEAIRQGGL